MRGLSLVAASGGHSSSRCAGLSLLRPLLLQSAGSVVVAHGLSCPVACGIFPDQGSNPCPLHWQADSQPLRHQGSPPRWALPSPFLLSSLALFLLPCGPGLFFLLLPWGGRGREAGGGSGSPRGASASPPLLSPCWPSASSLVLDIRGGVGEGLVIHTESQERPWMRPDGHLRVQVIDHVLSFRPRT